MIKFICIFNNLLYLSFQLKKYLWNYFSTGFWSIFPYQVKVSRQKAYVKRKHGFSCNKKGEQEHIQRFLHKMRFWKFLVWWISCAGCAHCVAVHVKTKLSRVLSQTSNLINWRWAIRKTIPSGKSITTS